MKWYDFFSLFYDRSLEALYRPAREVMREALSLAPGQRVIDLACGTGQNFDFIVPEIGETGALVGIDGSKGMLKRARKRIARNGWQNVELVCSNVAHLAELDLPRADRMVCSLGFTAFPNWQHVFDVSCELLRPGGRYVLLDVHAEKRTARTKSVELVARADLDRQIWTELEKRASDFRKQDIDTDAKTFGGTLFVASGSIC